MKMSECNNKCSSCQVEGCGERKKTSFLEEPHKLSKVNKVIGVVSGKGGVGKSLVTSLIASQLEKRGNHVGILDADITGPSIPKIFGIKEKAVGDDDGMYPVKSKSGVEVMSINLLLEDETEPVIWRGPVIGGVVKQFWTDVIWKDIDCLMVDMPPGTGDVPLSVFQMLPVDGIIIVTSPQELVSMIVEKAVKMAKMMNIPILGMVENMSYITCPDCGKKISVFGESNAENIASEYNIPLLAKIPMNPQIARLCDAGEIDSVEADFMDNVVKTVENIKK
jgi:Mrp family chromosome partitioning ATPase